MTTFQELEHKYGSIKHEGTKLYFMNQPYSAYVGHEVYRQHAIDLDHNHYDIIYEITRQGVEDESDACDWTKYKVIKQ